MDYRIYLAGSLFDHKALTGNRLLAAAIEAVSAGRFGCVLPQDLEQLNAGRHDIRNNDLKALMSCELALFNFDGPELDSGTVMEFVFAKMLDIPAVILRTDFRLAGDQLDGGPSFNLMLSGYPRTVVVELNAMALYHDHCVSGDLRQQLEGYYSELADMVVTAFDQVLNQPPVERPADAATLYRWVAAAVGGGYPELVESQIEETVRLRLLRGLL
ncbi:MAG: Nucleoside 2-deoxyribosyltransferase [Deltaproteobacteria bacterium ADurb.Bin510]|nr:MAG: Nucleoside 2-deoxyribosyltransferase [Deltaproteobacteria bacterium ADurb.Bin510]